MNEKPLERLNYYNGMPLNASDFTTEQEYHIRTRRWLNKSLYSAGIARGLEVRAVPGSRTVTVSPGLALDSEGREIILLEQEPVEVCSYAGTEGSDGTVVGNYLVIEYAEEAVAFERGGCAVRAAGTSASKSTAPWGGPSRVEAKPKFSWVPFVPQPGSNQIVLARVELKHPGCTEVRQIDAGARRYVGAASAAMVRQYALEGEKEVAFIPKASFPDPKPNDDIRVVGRIYFHIRGRQPNAVTLYLKAEALSPLHYTELGRHSHSANVQALIADHPITVEQTKHSHDLKEKEGTPLVTEIEKEDDTFFDGVTNFGPHEHWLEGRLGGSGAITAGGHTGMCIVRTNGNLQVLDDDVRHGGGRVVQWGRHRHRLVGPTAEGGFVLSLTHTLDTKGSSIGHQGAEDPSNVGLIARVGRAMTYLQQLKIAIDGRDRTYAIRDQIVDSVPGTQKPAWQLGLGDGTSNHPLANEAIDAVPIRLDFLPDVTFAEGQHVVELSVGLTPEGEANGGKILYNLYIE